MHNLFGDTDSVNVYLDEAGEVSFRGVEMHDTIEDMLRYVHLQRELMARYREKIFAAPLRRRGSVNAFLEALSAILSLSGGITARSPARTRPPCAQKNGDQGKII